MLMPDCRAYRCHVNIPPRGHVNLALINVGTLLHSHNYRDSENYQNKNVLVVGLGSSGADITDHLKNYTKTLYLSRHANSNYQHFEKIAILKPELSRITERTAIFADDTEIEVDAIIFCTGYCISLPFLDSTCGLDISRYKIYPLFKHMVNINNSTMFFINRASNILSFTAVPLEVQYCIKFLTGKLTSPSKDDMLYQLNEEIEEKKRLGKKDKHYHDAQYMMVEFLEFLSQMTGATKHPPIIGAIAIQDIILEYRDFTTFREYVYKIVDDNTFTCSLPGDENPEKFTSTQLYSILKSIEN